MAKLTDKTAFEGETLTADFTADALATVVQVNLANGKAAKNINATKVGDVWKFYASPDALKPLVGDIRWVAFSTTNGMTKVIENGRIYIRPLVSKYRAVVEAIDSAIATWGTNPNGTISVGEITVSAKSVDDLIRARAYYQGKADADEAGNFTTGGPRRVLVRF